jgi:hypothetical protein
LLMPNLKHLTHGISNLVSLITKTKLGLSPCMTACAYISLIVASRVHGLQVFLWHMACTKREGLRCQAVLGQT